MTGPAALGLGLALGLAQLVDVPVPGLEGLEPAVAGQLREVRRSLDEAVRDRRASADAYGQAGRHYHAYALTAAADACYRNAAVQAPDDFRWPYLRALLLEDDSRIEEAASSLERALSSADVYYPALVRLAALRLALGRPAEAEPILTRARAHAAEDPALLAVAGEVALALGRPGEAARQLEAALERRPEATRLRYPLAMAYRSMGRLDAARAELARAGTVGIRPSDPLLDGVLALRQGARVHLLEGQRAFAAGDHAGAAAAYRRALEASPTARFEALSGLAASEARLQRYEAALAHFEEAQALAPNDAGILYNRGVLLAHLGRPAEAEPLLHKAVERAPQDLAARVELAFTLLAISRVAESARELTRGLPVDACAELLQRLSRARDEARIRPEDVGRLEAALRDGPCRP